MKTYPMQESVNHKCIIHNDGNFKSPFGGREDVFQDLRWVWDFPKTLGDVSHTLPSDTFSLEDRQCHTGWWYVFEEGRGGIQGPTQNARHMEMNYKTLLAC